MQTYSSLNNGKQCKCCLGGLTTSQEPRIWEEQASLMHMSPGLGLNVSPSKATGPRVTAPSALDERKLTHNLSL